MRPFIRNIPLAWRGLALLCYGADLFGLGVLLPFVVWVLYPRSFFLRAHALMAGLVQAIGLVAAGVLHALNLIFIFESDNFIISYQQMFGQVFKSEPITAGMLLVLFSGIFFVTAIGAARRTVNSIGPGRIRKDRANDLADRAPLYALLAIAFVNLVIHNQGLWGAGRAAGPLGAEGGLFDDIFKTFSDPFRLLPGYPVTLWCAFLGLYAIRGEILWLRSARRLFARFALDERASDGNGNPGGSRWAGARLRSMLLPGWGQFFLGRRVAGVATFCAFCLFSFYLVISLGLNYGEWVKNLPGLNANPTWYFLSELGLRTQLTDAAFKRIFANPLTLAGLLLGVALLYVYSRWSTGRLYFARPGAGFWTQTAPSLLLHLAPLAMVFVIPIGFQLTPPPGSPPEQREIEPIPIIPEFFEKPDKKMETGGGAYSGNEAEKYTPGAAGENPREGSVELVESDEQRMDGPGPAPKQEQRAIGGRPGERQDLTYSNYISAKIRGPEIAGDFWERLPNPYAAVFEYKISGNGRLYDVRVREPSGHPEADELTIEMIKAMGHLLPPPGGETVVVTELFWNTSYADENLPTDLQRNLSRAFDGRVFEPY